MKSFTDIDEFLEQTSSSLEKEGINSAEYWYARFDISEEDYANLASQIIQYSIQHHVMETFPLVSLEDVVNAIAFAFSVGLNVGLIHGSQYDDVTAE